MKFQRFVIALSILLFCLALSMSVSAQDAPPDEPTPTLEATVQILVPADVVIVSDATEEPTVVVAPVVDVTPEPTSNAPSWDDVLSKIILGLAVIGLIFSSPPQIRKKIDYAGAFVKTTSTPIDDLAFQAMKPYLESIAELSELLRSTLTGVNNNLPGKASGTIKVTGVTATLEPDDETGAVG